MPNLYEAATTDPNLTILAKAVTALDAAGLNAPTLKEVLEGAAPITVFAPTNDAFRTTVGELGFAGGDDDAVVAFLIDAFGADTVNAIVRYHVSAGAQLLADIGDGGTVTSVDGGTFLRDGPTLVDAEQDVIDPSFVPGGTDIVVDNGVVQLIDRVLLPVDSVVPPAPTIMGILDASGPGFDSNGGDFDLLRTAVETAGLNGALDDAGADLTAFAPKDDAFLGLAAAFGFEGDGEAEAFGYIVEALTLLSEGGDPVPLLSTILGYHVTGESLQASQVLSAAEIPTLSGPLGVSGATLVDADPDLPDPTIIATDIQAGNGVVHVIDGVLSPVDLPPLDGAGGVDFLILGDDDDRAVTGRGDDFVDGNGGGDRLIVGRGDDVALGGTGADFILGGSGSDVLFGGGGRDVVFGGQGNDEINGGEGRDKIRGGAGDDVIDGGAGNDLLVGSRGDDVFVYAEGGGRDAILDFRNGHDVIDLTGAGIADFDELLATSRSGLFSTTITLGDDDSLKVWGLGRSDLDEGDFVFA